LSLGSGSLGFRFNEIMAYSQEAIHIKAKKAILSSESVSNLEIGTTPGLTCLTTLICKAANLIRSTLRTVANGTGSSNTCCVISGEQTDPFLEVSLNAEVLIDAVILTPIDKVFANSL
jgi:hypothetical protein